MTSPAPKSRRKPAPSRAPAPMADKAFITLTLDRASSALVIDEEFSTPMETWAMLKFGFELTEQRLFDKHQPEDAE